MSTDANASNNSQETKELQKYDVPKDHFTIISKYKEIVGDLWISPRFKVPQKEPWPEIYHGYALGKAVSFIRKQKESNVLSSKSVMKLEKLGLQWNCQKRKAQSKGKPSSETTELQPFRRAPNFEHVKEALCTYKSIYGDLLVPQNYFVPNKNARYASHLHGMKLGRIVGNIRCRNNYSKYREELIAMGFQYENLKNTFSFTEIKEALLAYKRKEGDLLVHIDYTIPANDCNYAEYLWGIKLGIIAFNIRNNDSYAEHKEELLAMGFCYENINRPRNWEHVKEALLTYKSIHGHLWVPQRYFISDHDPRYAPYLHGMKLGNVVSDIRIKNCYFDHRDEILAMGIRYGEKYAHFNIRRQRL